MINFKGDKLKRNAVINVIRQLMTIVFPLITFPYISRIMGSENLGKFSFTASIISYISLIAGLGINNYAIREASRVRDDKQKLDRFISEIFTLNFLALLLAFSILAVIIICVDTYDYRVLLLIQAVTVFFTVIGCDWLNTVFEDFLYITVRYAILQTIAVVLMFCLIKESSDLFLYAGICQFAIVFGSIINLVYFYKKREIKLVFEFKKTIFQHLGPVMILFGNAAAMLIYVNSDITIIGIFCGDSQVGIYSVSVKVYTIVKQLLNAMMIVGIPRMASWAGRKSKTEIDAQLNEMLSTLLIYLIPCMVGLYCLSDCAVVVLAGEGFLSAQGTLKILSMALFFSTGVCFYSNLVLIPNNMEKHILRATTISAVLNIILNLVLIPYFGITAAAYTTLFSEFVTVFYMIMVSKPIYFPEVKKSFIISIISAGIVFIVCKCVEMNITNLYIRAVVAIALSLTAWALFRFLVSMWKKRALNK